MKTVPVNQPFFVVVRQRHIDGACTSKTDQCVIARALDEAFPDCAGEWRVSGCGLSLMSPTFDVKVLASWDHDASEAVFRFDRGQGFPPNLRVHFTPCAPNTRPTFDLTTDTSGYAVAQVIKAAQQKWGMAYLTNGQITS